MAGSTNQQIATVYLTSKLKQTLVAVLGVTFGISMYVFMNSFMTGVNDIQTDLAFSSLAHIRVYNDGPADNTDLVSKVRPAGTIAFIRSARIIQYTEGIKHSGEILAFLRQQPELTAITPQVNVNVFFRNGANHVNGTLSGVDVENEDKVFHISTYMKEGNWKELKYRSDGVFLGTGLARTLSLKVDDNVNVLTPDGVSKTFKVIGTFETGVTSVDKTKAYLAIGPTRQLLSKNADYVTDIQVNIADFHQATAVAHRIAPVFPYKTESWSESNQQLEAGSRLRDIIAVAVSLTILLVAGFGIYNIMNMTINEKIREIAILKAMGFAGRDITTIFLTLAMVIGVVGGVIGLGLGYTVSVTVNHIPFRIANLEHLPMAYRWQDYLYAFAFGLATTFVAGYLPARKASRIDPVEIIRG
ncbi:ABC transporter permease [Dinghuibacter silviterrae]|uniref:Lipoprotein-releasing system permease protein n=1 Tax=Dinghuibacter silviterrae TaxID=1539049 RepID=A0A4V3GKP1_9BACT|nr:FtsX-like permease family protein [Dinghuibacter silviterrae]TDW96422.1 lipoprotein-releasing system permease protein [Dinghuibacter silviterrae]